MLESAYVVTDLSDAVRVLPIDATKRWQSDVVGLGMYCSVGTVGEGRCCQNGFVGFCGCLNGLKGELWDVVKVVTSCEGKLIESGREVFSVMATLARSGPWGGCTRCFALHQCGALCSAPPPFQ